MRQQSINITSWDKPWIPELDWLNSYRNLSTYDQNVLDALAVGYKVSKYTKYRGTSKWGCFLTFRWDEELAHAYYLEHFNNTNETLLLMAPNFPVRPGVSEELSKRRLSSSILGLRYRPGIIKEWYQQVEFGYIWRANGVRIRLALAAAVLISIIGVFGEYPL